MLDISSENLEFLFILDGYKREQFFELLKMQRLIAKEMYTHPDYNKRDLEVWG